MLGLSAYPHAAWQAYNLALAAHPIFTKCMTSLTCFILSDTVAQLPSGKVPYPPPQPPIPGPAFAACLSKGRRLSARALRSLMPCGLRALRRLASWCTHPPAMCGTTSWTTMSTPASRPGATLDTTTERYHLLCVYWERLDVSVPCAHSHDRSRTRCALQRSTGPHLHAL